MIRTIFTIVIVIGSLQASAQKMDKIEIQTSAICEMCQYAIEKEMAFEKGVKEASLDLDSKKLTVFYNPKKTDPDVIRKRVTLTGYHADDMERDPEAYENLPECCKDGAHQDDEH